MTENKRNELHHTNRNMARKPKANHPWRTGPTPEVVKWAAETSKKEVVNTWKVGGGKSQK